METTIKRLATCRVKRSEGRGYWFFKTEDAANAYITRMKERFGYELTLETI